MASEAPLHFIQKQSVAQDLLRHPVKKAVIGGENRQLEVVKSQGHTSASDGKEPSHSEDFVFEIQATSKKVEEAILMDSPSLDIENIEHPEKKTISELEGRKKTSSKVSGDGKIDLESEALMRLDVVNGNDASESAPVDPKWETIVKSSNVHHGHLRFCEELLPPIPET
ncbi:hypothetical protein NL676_001020 [Syzygium grande]|nr:hypothetical protein NL676_001020 [Syzygium grande]